MVPLLAVMLVFAALVGVGLVHLAATAADRAAAQAAADAVALAAAGGTTVEAHTVARENGATVAAIERDGFDVEVVVRRRGHTARARARWSPERYDEALAPVSSVPARSGAGSTPRVDRWAGVTATGVSTG